MTSPRKSALALLSALFLLGACSKDKPDPGPAAGVRKAPAELTRAASIGYRRAPLTDPETEHLRAGGVTRLYWHSADVFRALNEWQFPEENPAFAPQLPDGFERVPVLRLAPSPDTAENRGSFPALGEFIASYLERDPADFLQIEFDCPERLLPRYAELLGYVRSVAKPKHLSVTAVASWIDKPGFDAIQEQVDEIAVILYDLHADMPPDISAGKAVPMVDLEAIRVILPQWRNSCRKPWLVVLPNFSRLSVFNENGQLSDQRVEWNPNALVFNPDLEFHRRSPDGGTTWLTVKAPVFLADRFSADPAQQVVVRQPTSESLRESIRLAAESGASGVVWSPLPAPDGDTGFTASHLAALLESNPSPATPNLSVTHDANTGTLVLANNGPYDLPVRILGGETPVQWGWQLEIDGGDIQAFTEAAPGEFARMRGYLETDGPEPAGTPVTEARSLVFSFAALPAGARLESGPLRRQPGATLRWRLDRGGWQKLSTTP